MALLAFAFSIQSRARAHVFFFAINTRDRRVLLTGDYRPRVFVRPRHAFFFFFMPPKCADDTLLSGTAGIKNDVCRGSGRSKISQLCQGKPSVPDFSGVRLGHTSAGLFSFPPRNAPRKYVASCVGLLWPLRRYITMASYTRPTPMCSWQSRLSSCWLSRNNAFTHSILSLYFTRAFTRRS